MSAWKEAVVCGIYTVSPLHVSTGQAEGAIDLPVTKEPHTGFAVIPASSLKGVAREAFAATARQAKPTGAGTTPEETEVEELFGPTLKRTNDLNEQETKAEKVETNHKQNSAPKLFTGALVFTEARLVAYAARSLNRPFLYVTCRLVLERLGRDLRAAGITTFENFSLPMPSAEVLVTDAPLANTTLVLEDLVYSGNVAQSSDLTRIADSLARLLPALEVDTRNRLKKGLVVIPDQDFAMLARRLPVRARIKLGENKTTSGDDGNLWYEEQVPADCLFVAMIGERSGKGGALKSFREKRTLLAVSQIGGNETVGEGICLWTVGHEPVKNGEGTKP